MKCQRVPGLEVTDARHLKRGHQNTADGRGEENWDPAPPDPSQDRTETFLAILRFILKFRVDFAVHSMFHDAYFYQRRRGQPPLSPSNPPKEREHSHFHPSRGAQLSHLKARLSCGTRYTGGVWERVGNGI